MTPSDRMAIRQAALPLGLFGRAVSAQAEGLVDHLLSTEVCPRLATGQRRPSTLPALRQTVEGLLAALLQAHSKGLWAKRSLSDGSFTAEPVSHRQFGKVYQALEASGHLEWFRGFSDRSGFGHRGGLSCFRLTTAGLELAKGLGVDPAGPVGDHFTTT